ncbi:feruloyl coa ortho-hydroxylase 1 [Quercus suber]|uniref:Feruloyl coa ortho-hydroxylase 1 n=1 Tax=Quercus suber TaxID=58331 RepID=A0AAW0KZM1_QUESU
MAPTVATPMSESSDITDFIVTKGNGVKGLSEMGPKTLPRQYIQPLEEWITEKWGFFQVINHGVSIEVLENVKDATHKFFNLPAEEKRKFSKENSPSNNVRGTMDTKSHHYPKPGNR